MTGHEFLQTIDDDHYEILFEKATAQKMSVQKLIRHIIVPDWIRKQESLAKLSRSK